jgi:glutamine amidotransferase
MLAIIDYQAGNQTSVKRALDHLGINSEITNRTEILKKAQGLIFPGVGAAGQAMDILKRSGLDKLIAELIGLGRPFLGICLGCQIMLEYSEEDEGTQTLGLLKGRTLRFSQDLIDEDGRSIRIPHMGWNKVKTTGPNPLWHGLNENDQFYFVHSYYPLPAPELILGQTQHGLSFASVFGRDGLWALQFHPEKSGHPGLKILQNFFDYSARLNYAK